MKNLIQAAVVTLFAASAAQAQQAVQWKVSAGGNGHWYKMVITPSPTRWEAAKVLAESIGGHLATIRSDSENGICLAAAVGGPELPGGSVWLGGIQPDGEASAFAWVTGEPFDWTPGCGFSNSNSGCGYEDRLTMTSPWSGCPWNDVAACWFIPAILVEWDADCNGDGVVDYGQCQDGTLPDYNGNNTPDCCERGEACVFGTYPVQWPIADGGNGHWYQLVFEGHPSWTQAKLLAEQRGGYLATLTSQGENDLAARLSRGLSAMLLGGFQDHASPKYSEPAGGWRWITDEPWNFSNWGAGEPNNASNGHGEPGEDYLSSWTGAQGFKWGDGDNICPECNPGPFLVEWSADCDNDGIVDFGKILQGELTDANSDGIPDICEQSTCRDADLFRDFNVNGADLGILLSQWGPNTALTVSDINKDGSVNGADLGIMLSFWGACP